MGFERGAESLIFLGRFSFLLRLQILNAAFCDTAAPALVRASSRRAPLRMDPSGKHCPPSCSFPHPRSEPGGEEEELLGQVSPPLSPLPKFTLGWPAPRTCG